jgi:hypothetical protein
MIGIGGGTMSAVDLSGDDLTVITGGAGFIGSHIACDLAKAGLRVVVADLLRSGNKWRNIAAAELHDVIRPDTLFEWLDRHSDKVPVIVHMGAVSSTTEADVDRFVTNNIRLTLDLWGMVRSECHAVYLRLVGRDLRRRQRWLRGRSKPGRSCRAAPPQCVRVEQARHRPSSGRRRDLWPADSAAMDWAQVFQRVRAQRSP